MPTDSRAVLDGSGELRYVVLPDGISYERGLTGAWSVGRQHPGQVIVVKTSEVVRLRSADGKIAVHLPRESEQVLDNGTPVAYRQFVRGEPRVFLPDGDGWKQAEVPVDPVRFEAWLASAEPAREAARTLYDIADRSDPGLPEAERLTTISTEGLRNLLARLGGRRGRGYLRVDPSYREGDAPVDADIGLARARRRGDREHGRRGGIPGSSSSTPSVRRPGTAWARCA